LLATHSRKITRLAVLIVNALSTSYLSAAQNTHSGTLGDIRLSLTAARVASEEDIQQYKLFKKPGYHSVLVFLRAKNVANYSNCTYLEYWVGVNLGYQYKGNFLGKREMVMMSLPPGEGTEGVIQFQVKDGTKPSTLKILRDKVVDDACARGQHRERPIFGPVKILFSLQGLPSKP